MHTIEEMLAFAGEGKSPFHAVAAAKNQLEAAGFAPLCEAQTWHLVPGGRYYVTRNLSSVIAFTVPQSGFGSMLIAASHSDSPTFKVKELGDTVVSNFYTRLNTEGYGGMLCATWFDRPLSVAGRVMVKTETGVSARLVDIDRDLLVIPSVAIHMNRTANDGYAYNKATDLQPLFGTAEAQGALAELVAEAANVSKEAILSADLSLYVRQQGTVLGAKKELVLAPRLDDLGCAWATLQGFFAAQAKAMTVWAMFDNEEVGSTTKQGACSTFLADTLRRVCAALGGTEQDYLCALPASMLVSADNGHALHPNHPELADPASPVRLNGGIVLKYNANQKYTTDAVSAALFRTVCARAGVPLQVFANRPDLPGGSTLGNLSNQQVSLNAVDIGLPQLAMHSACETAGANDALDMVKALTAFYSAVPTCAADGEFSL